MPDIKTTGVSNILSGENLLEIGQAILSKYSRSVYDYDLNPDDLLQGMVLHILELSHRGWSPKSNGVCWVWMNQYLIRQFQRGYQVDKSLDELFEKGVNWGEEDYYPSLEDAINLMVDDDGNPMPFDEQLIILLENLWPERSQDILSAVEDGDNSQLVYDFRRRKVGEHVEMYHLPDGSLLFECGDMRYIIGDSHE